MHEKPDAQERLLQAATIAATAVYVALVAAAMGPALAALLGQAS